MFVAEIPPRMINLDLPVARLGMRARETIAFGQTRSTPGSVKTVSDEMHSPARNTSSIFYFERNLEIYAAQMGSTRSLLLAVFFTHASRGAPRCCSPGGMAHVHIDRHLEA